MKIHSIFESISGEAGPVIAQGAWTTFIRTQTCNLQCGYCDTKETWDEKKGMECTVNDIVKTVFTKNVLLTGGEPLIQPESYDLIYQLCRMNHIVQIETNGTIWDLPRNPGVGYSVDIKCPCSGMEKKMPAPDMVSTIHGIQIDLKFVVKNEDDVEFAMNYVTTVAKYNPRIRFVFSPVDAITRPELIQNIINRLKQEGQWILDRTVFSLQIHKILNMP
jgi:7-carboxy-7-deazaguanine synthase